MNLYDKCPYDWLVHLEDENRLQKSYTGSLYHNKQSPLPDFGLVVEKVFFLKRADPCKVFAVANQAIPKESKVSTKRRSSLNNPGTHCSSIASQHFRSNPLPDIQSDTAWNARFNEKAAWKW